MTEQQQAEQQQAAMRSLYEALEAKKKALLKELATIDGLFCDCGDDDDVKAMLYLWQATTGNSLERATLFLKLYKMRNKAMRENY